MFNVLFVSIYYYSYYYYCLDYKDANQDLVNVVFLSSSGAGFKQLCVILDQVDAFILMEVSSSNHIFIIYSCLSS